MAKVNLRKIAIIGCGFVGSASAFALMQSKMFSEIVLIDADKDKAEGEGIKFPRFFKPYIKYVLPVLVLIVFISGFIPQG